MRLSASQVQTFVDCPRKWSWKYVAGVEELPGPAAELGRLVHLELEKYLNGGEIDYTTEVGYIAASGLEHLPKPGTPGLVVEAEFHFVGPSGHSYLGYKDLQSPRVIYDHKTTSDLKWQKTEEDLRNDIQATLYAVDYFREHSDENEVELRWVYYQTRNTRKSAITVLRVNQTEAWNRFLTIEQIAQEMEIASTKQPLDLPPNINHCSAYGGCPHQGRCNLSPFEKMRAHMEQNKLTQLLQARKNGAAAPMPAEPVSAVHAVPAPPTPAPVVALPVPAVAAAGGNKLLARLQAGGAPSAAVAGAAPAVRATVEPAVAAVPATAPVAAINPPEYQPAPPAPAPAPAPAPVDTLPTARAVPTPAALPVTASPVAAVTAPAAAAESRGRGRPKKAVVPATGLAVKIETLYLDCGPVGVPVVDATQFIALGKKRIAAEGIADYRFVEFGQGAGMLAVAAVTELDALEGVVPAVRLDTTTPEGSIIAVEFQARAGLVVR
jgi:hypothetical protein